MAATKPPLERVTPWKPQDAYTVLFPNMRPQDWGLQLKGSFHYGGKLISKSNDKSRFLSKRYRDFERDIAQHAKAARLDLKLPHGWVFIYPCFESKTHIDLTNGFKSIVDGLVKGGVFTDDKLVAGTVTLPVYGRGLASVIEIWG